MVKAQSHGELIRSDAVGHEFLFVCFACFVVTFPAQWHGRLIVAVFSDFGRRYLREDDSHIADKPDAANSAITPLFRAGLR